MTNVFRPVDGDSVLPDRIFQGQNWRNIQFGAAATVIDYANAGLYLEVGTKPAHDQYSRAVVSAETANHISKQVELTWDIEPLPAEQIAEIVRREEFEAEAADMVGVNMAQAVTWLNTRLDGTTLDVATKTELRRIFRKIISFLPT